MAQCARYALCGCVHVECGRSFFARGDLTQLVASSGAHRPRPSLREHPPRCLAHTPHAPALVPPVVDHLPCRGGVSLRSRSACAAQQVRPTPSSPEEKTNCEGRKKLRSGMPIPVGSETPRSGPLGTHRSTRKYAHHVLITWHSTNSGAPGTPTRAVATANQVFCTSEAAPWNSSRPCCPLHDARMSASCS